MFPTHPAVRRGFIKEDASFLARDDEASARGIPEVEIIPIRVVAERRATFSCVDLAALLSRRQSDRR